jgi:hypothetical protein
MMDVDVAADIEPLTAFKRDTVRFAKRLKRSGRPMVLTVEGRARFVVFDAQAFEDWKEQVETVLAVNEALSEQGEGRLAEQVHADLRQKYFGLSRRVPKAG